MQVTIGLGNDFTPTCMAHPDTYLNKVVVGSQQGSMQLWNFATGTRLYEFKMAECAIKCLAPSPALDVVGIGLADGCARSLKRHRLNSCHLAGSPALSCCCRADCAFALLCVHRGIPQPKRPIAVYRGQSLCSSWQKSLCSTWQKGRSACECH